MSEDTLKCVVIAAKIPYWMRMPPGPCNGAVSEYENERSPHRDHIYVCTYHADGLKSEWRSVGPRKKWHTKDGARYWISTILVLTAIVVSIIAVIK